MIKGAPFGKTFKKTDDIKSKPRIGGISGRTSLAISPSSMISSSKDINSLKSSVFFNFFLRSSTIEAVYTRLLPITWGHNVFRLFSGRPNFHKESKSEVLTLIPRTLPYKSKLLSAVWFLKQQQIASIPLTITLFYLGFFLV